MKKCTTSPLCMVAACGMLLSAASAAHAQTDLYIAEYQFNAARISAVNLDGANPRTLFNLPAAQWLPIGLAFNPANARLYWTDAANGSDVVSATLTGTGNTSLQAIPGSARGTSLDALGRIYASSNNNLYRINAAGGGLTTIYTSPTTSPIGNPTVDAANGHIYVGVDGQILRMNLDGTGIRVVINGVSQPRAIALDIANSRIYWIDADTITDFVATAKLDGSEFSILLDNTPNASASSGLADLAIDFASGFIYVADELRDIVRRLPISGGSATTIYTSATGKSPSGLAFSTGAPIQPIQDCDANGIADVIDIANGAPDCDNNGLLDACQALACPAYDFLLNTGSDAADTQGRAVGIPSSWQVFQPFDVPAEGWIIGQVGTDGFTSAMSDMSGLSVVLFPDNGTGNAPFEGDPIATARVDLRFNTFRENWVYAPLQATLAQGRYWIVIKANNPTVYGASVNRAALSSTALPSKSRGTSGTFTNSTRPIALRLIRGVAACGTADFDGDGDSGTDSDIESFFACLAGNCCQTCQSADFDADGDTGTDADIEAFFRVLAGQPC